MARRKEAIRTLEGSVQSLETFVRLLEERGGRPSVSLLESIGDRVREAIDLLKMPDSERKRIEFILLAIQESTEVRKHVRNRRTVTRVHVIDLDLYNWGMEKLHALASPA